MSKQSRYVIRKQSTGRRIIEQSRVRLWCVALFFFLCFGSICARMIEVAVINNEKAMTITVLDDEGDEGQEVALQSSEPTLQRGDIVDRNGVLLATSLMTESVFANPREIKEPKEAAARVSEVLGMDRERLLKKFSSKKSFLWVKRNLTPREQQAINSLGIPGLYFLPEERRVYPYSNILAHTVGYVGIDNKGLAGMEKALDQRLRDAALNRDPVALSVDVRLQGILHEEMTKAVQEFRAIGATGAIMDLRSGELLSMVSLPDFDPHEPGKASADARFNRTSLGAYEMGSTFKSFTMAMALEHGVANMKSTYDTVNPLRISTFTIRDAHPANHHFNLPEIYAYSSNIGTARIALEVGTQRQKAFMKRLGMLDPIDIELPEKTSPLYPSDWKEINTVTISYGHGISVTPLHLVRGIASMVNGGILPRLTLLKDGNKNKTAGERLISENTSRNVRRLMRLVVEHGTGSKAAVTGYRVAGKTGTAEKIRSSGKYDANAKMASFVGVFPIDDPRYVVLVMIDEPKGNKATYNFATGGWISAPVVGRMINRMGPMLGIKPVYDAPEDDAEKFWVENDPAKVAPPKKAANKRYIHAVAY